jgi:hypothetical protein
MEAIRFFETCHPHGATSQKMAFFIVTAMKTSNPKAVSSLKLRREEAVLKCV